MFNPKIFYADKIKHNLVTYFKHYNTKDKDSEVLILYKIFIKY